MLEALCEEFKYRTIDLTDHYLDQLVARPTPGRRDLQFVLCNDDPEIIEYNSDNSCLIWGRTKEGRIVHVSCSYPPGGRVITAYWPEERPDKWTDNYKIRL